MQQAGTPRRLGDISAQQGGGALPLSVVMGPRRPRTTISFQPREGLSNASSQRPTLTVFAHEPGSRVHKDLFPVYRMPNGQLAFMYYTAGRVQVLSPCASARYAAVGSPYASALATPQPLPLHGSLHVLHHMVSSIYISQELSSVRAMW